MEGSRRDAGVALDGDLAVAGAPLDFAGGVQKGAAYVWRRSGGNWALEATLAPSDGTATQAFGNAIATDGDVIAVGSPQADGFSSASGAVFLYERIAGAWTETAKLVGSDAGPNHEPYSFGESLDLQGDELVVGCPIFRGGDYGSGLVFVYRKQGGAWIESGRVEASDAHRWASFGRSVDLDGDRLLVGASGANCHRLQTGAAYLFERSSNAWLERSKLASSERSVLDRLGKAVALDGTHALLGAPGRDDAYSDAGAAYVFDASIAPPVGTAYCPGDGSGTPCPCGNDSPPGAGRGCLNSRGLGAWLEARGSTSLSADDLAFYARDIPAQQPCMLLANLNAVGGGAGVSFGDGLRCVGGSVERVAIGFGGIQGVVSWSPALDQGTPWGAGDAVRLQGWYRDVGPGPCAQGFNLTNGVELVLTP